MTSKIRLSDLQEKSWRCAQKASNVAADEIKSLQEAKAELEEAIHNAARLAAKAYSGILDAIAAEHHVAEIPVTAQLSVEDGVTYFVWEDKTPKAKKKAKKKLQTTKKTRGRPKGSKNKPKPTPPEKA